MEFSNVNWSLYAIIDKSFLGGRPIEQIAEALLEGGVGVIQLRDKTGDIRAFYDDALALKQVAAYHQAPFIVNDRADVAIAADADGVHVGQEDLPVPVVKALLGKDKIIGVSVHDLQEFERVAGHDPTYFGLGTIYKTATKSERNATGTAIIKQVRARTDKPIVAIGGIDVANAAPVIEAGADGVAVISALLCAPDVRTEAEAFIRTIQQTLKKKRPI